MSSALQEYLEGAGFSPLDWYLYVIDHGTFIALQSVERAYEEKSKAHERMQTQAQDEEH